MKFTTLSVAILAAVAVAASGSIGFAATDIRAEIEAANDLLEAGFAARDGDQMSQCYTEDGQLLPPGAPLVSGKAAIAEFWGGVVQSAPPELELVTVEVDQYGDTAVEVGIGNFRDADGNIVSTAKFVVVWKNVNGQWYLHRDIWNADS